jgi:hypothetical protein
VIVCGTCIGHYKKYGGRNEIFVSTDILQFMFFVDTRKRLIGLHGILVGVGEIVGNVSDNTF